MTTCTVDAGDAELLRYSRHLLLDEFGTAAQERFARAHALVIGVGGLGAPAAQFLVAAGVGTVTLCDDDVVDLTNLQRQILHMSDAVGRLKVESGRDTLARINPECRVLPIAERLTGERLEAEVAAADIVLDCSDNFATRHAINRACVRHAKPLVSGAAIRFDGQVAVFDSRRDHAPCYNCLFPEGGDVEEVRCAVMGVFAPLTGIIGATQAAEALKLLIGCGEPLAGRLLLLDGLAMEWRAIAVPRDPACAVCSAHRPD